MKINSINPNFQTPNFKARPRKIEPQLIKDYVEMGMAYAEIADKLDLTYHQVYNAYAEIVKQNKAKLLKQFKPQIISLIDKKYSVDEISKRLKINPIELEEIIKTFNQTVFHSESYNCKKPIDESGKIRLLLREGDSGVQVAEIYGVSTRKVHSWLRECGIENPPDKPSPTKEEVLEVLEEERKLYHPVGKIFNFGSKLGISNVSFSYLVEKYGFDELFWRIKYNL